MTRTLQASIDTALARGTVYQCLAQACAYPGETFTEALVQGTWLASLEDAVEALEGVDAYRETLETLKGVQPTIEPTALRNEYTRLFSNTALTDFPPYGADYLASHIFMKAQTLADVAGFYRAFGVEVTAGTERPDHISAELDFMAYLCFKQAYAAESGLVEAFEITTAAQQRFLVEHVGRGAPLFLKRFEMGSEAPFYRALAAFAQVFLSHEAMRLSVAPEPIFEVPRDTPVAGDFTCGVGEDQCPLVQEGWAGDSRYEGR